MADKRMPLALTTGNPNTRMLNSTTTDDTIKQDFQTFELYFLVTVSTLQSIIGSVANIITLITILLNRRLHHVPSNLLILNLAMVDLLSCAIFLPFHVHNLVQERLSKILRFAYHTLCLFHIFCNGNAVFAITIDRFIAIAYPLRYKSLVTHQRSVLVIFLSWLMPCVSAVGFYISLQKDSPKSSEYVLRVYIILSLVAVLVFYFLVYRAARRQRNKIMATNRTASISSCGMETSNNKIWTGSPVWKSTVNTFLVVCLYFVTYLPILIYDLTFSVDKQLRYTSISERVYAWVLSFTFLNSCINPFLYAFRNRQFKKAFFNLLPTALKVT